MRKPGLLSPDDFKDLTDDELHDVKVEGQPGSNYWEWAQAEQDRRDKGKPSKPLKPHLITVSLTVATIIISILGLWINYSRRPTTPPPVSELTKTVERPPEQPPKKVEPRPIDALYGAWMGRFILLNNEGVAKRSGTISITFHNREAVILASINISNRPLVCPWTESSRVSVLVICPAVTSTDINETRLAQTYIVTLSGNSLDGSVSTFLEDGRLIGPPLSFGLVRPSETDKKE